MNISFIIIIEGFINLANVEESYFISYIFSEPNSDPTYFKKDAFILEAQGFATKFTCFGFSYI